MTKYVEEFKIRGITYGIEDRGARFSVKKKTDRFHVWSGGCGVASCPTIEVARTHIYRMVKEQLSRDKATATNTLQSVDEHMEKLGSDVFRLAQFLVIR